MRKSAVILSAFALVLGVFGISASATASADVPGLEIGTIGYNAYGSDRAWNRNQEFVDIVNNSADAVDVKGLRVEDAWAHGRGDGAGKCNNYTVSAVPGVPEVEGKLMLPKDHVLRVYVGSGEPKVFGDGLRWHAVYMNSDPGCGYYGHFLNNSAQKDRSAPWETVWVTLKGGSESKSYNFSGGYTVKP
jgi:hypothetical protein